MSTLKTDNLSTTDNLVTIPVADLTRSSKLGIPSVRDYITTIIDGVVDNQVGIQAAIDASIANDTSLWWPAGTYVSSSNITNFHSVKHSGPGIVKRGADLFAVEPTQNDTNRIYLGGAGGSSSNDGLSAAQPLNTFQPAFDILKNYGPVLSGLWELIAAAGSYNLAAGQQTFTVPSRQRVVIKGPAAGHPAVPTAVISGGGAGADYSHGLAFTGNGVYVTVQDLLFTGFNGDPSASTRGALLFDDGADGYTNNVHVTGSSWFGVYWSRRSFGRQQGGIIDACRNGVNTDGAKLSLGYNATSTANAPVIQNCTESGAYWARGTDGHSDFVLYKSNAIGLFIDSNSRVDAVGSDFQLNNYGVRTTSGGIFGNNPGTPCVFNIGTGLANVIQDTDYRGLSGEGTEILGGPTNLHVAVDRTTRTASGIGSFPLSTLYTMVPNRLNGAQNSLVIEVQGIYTVTAGSTFSFVVGGLTLALAVPAAATSAVFNARFDLHSVGGGYRAFGSLVHNLSTTRTGTATAGFVDSVSNVVSIEASLTGAGDSINVYRSNVYLVG